MANLLFCNIGWMSYYKGVEDKPDKIVNGGRYVKEHGCGGETCNFLVANDGWVYGHVETYKAENVDRAIVLENFGGSNGPSDRFDVIWTATAPSGEGGGRRIVGWYRNAIVFRERQFFEKFPSAQYRKDCIARKGTGKGSYRIKARAKDVHLLDVADRKIHLGRGHGWLGQTQWWAPNQNSPAEIQKFARKVHRLLNQPQGGATGHAKPNGPKGGANTPGASSIPYTRYLTMYEATISPRHDKLQRRFEKFLPACGATNLKPNIDGVDLRFLDNNNRSVLSEIKPCDADSVRYAIRTAMGQLLDYAQRSDGTSRLLVVVEKAPKDEDRQLALSNGFGLAHPSKGGFTIHWPPDHS